MVFYLLFPFILLIKSDLYIIEGYKQDNKNLYPLLGLKSLLIE